jgi:hypothetical protein
VVRIESGQQELDLRLKRIANSRAEGWYSGDTHVHFLSTQGAHFEARGEGLDVVNLLQAQWGSLFTNSEDFIGQPSVSRDGETIVYTSQENRQHFLGHLGLLGLKSPVMPWSSDGPSEAELGGSIETTPAHWADRCHDQGGTVVFPHFPDPIGQLAALIATGRIDAVELSDVCRFSEYYRYLNGGYRLPIAGGTDKMSSDVAVGSCRTYVQLPLDEPFTFEAWCRNLTAGKSYMSGGPLLSFSIEGHEIGQTIRLKKGGGSLDLTAQAHSTLPFYSLEVLHNGEVVASAEEADGANRLQIKTTVRVDADSWLAVRVGGPKSAQYIFHGLERRVLAHSSPIYVECGDERSRPNAELAQYMKTQVQMGLKYLRTKPLRDAPGRITHHHGLPDHQIYLEEPLHEALAAIELRSRRD